MKNGRNPIPLTNTRGVLGLLGGVYWGRSPVPEMKNGRGPFTQKGEKKKMEKGEGIRKNTGVVENPNTRVR
jgi:hypothetical protein